MRRMLALWEKEYLALSRDVLGLAVLFLMPAAFIVVMSLALSDVFRGGTGRGTEFAVIATDGKFAKQLSERLVGDGFRPTPEPVERGVLHTTKPALSLIVPPGFERALDTPPGKAHSAPALTLIADPVLPPMQLLAFKQRVLGVVLALRISAMMRQAGIAVNADALDLKHAATLNVETIGGSGRPSSVQQNVPSSLVGGIMVPRFVMPEAMQKLSEVSPMAWALDAFHAVILRGGGAADIAAPCAKLLALATALFAAALWVHYRRRVLTSAQ